MFPFKFHRRTRARPQDAQQAPASQHKGRTNPTACRKKRELLYFSTPRNLLHFVAFYCIRPADLSEVHPSARIHVPAMIHRPFHRIASCVPIRSQAFPGTGGRFAPGGGRKTVGERTHPDTLSDVIHDAAERHASVAPRTIPPHATHATTHRRSRRARPPPQDTRTPASARNPRTSRGTTAA